MKKMIAMMLAVVLAISLTGCAAKAQTVNVDSVLTLADLNQYYGTTFGQGQVTDVNVEISENDWQDILDNASDEEYHSADVTVNGTMVTNVGFRTKGFSSLMSVSKSDSERYGFKVKLDEYVDNQSLNGLDQFVLNGSFADPSYMREYLTYAAMAELEGITPCVSYVSLSVNGTLFGFYLMVESYDDSFVKRYSTDAEAVMYKAVSENCTLLPSDDGSGFDVDAGKDDSRTNIKNLVEVLNSTTEDNKSNLESVLDVDSVLKAIALNTVTGNYDSYNGSKAHNYYLLYSDGKFSYVGWDYNMSMGGFSEDNGSSVSVDVLAPVLNTTLSQRPLIEKLLAISEYKEQYLGYINQLKDYFSNFEGKVSAVASVISSYVKADPSAFYTFNQFKDNIKDTGTDLSQKTAIQAGGNGNWNNTKPDGDTTSDGLQTVSGDTNSIAGDKRTPPNGWTGSRPDGPTGSRPDGQRMPGEMGGGMGGNMISQESVSIVDYITQRIEKINAQLDSTVSSEASIKTVG